jgi:hypothetical protein
MTGRRVTALELAPAARGAIVRAYGTRQEAEACTRPVGVGLELICIVTGVPHSPACGGGL